MAENFVPFDQQARNRVSEAYQAARADYGEKLDAAIAAALKLGQITLALDVIERAAPTPIGEIADDGTRKIASIGAKK